MTITENIYYRIYIFPQAAADAETDRSKFKRIHEECQVDPKTKVSDDFMRRASRGERGDDPNGKAHTLCMSTKMGFQDAHGKVVKAQVKNALSRTIKEEDKLEEATNKCAVDKDDPQDTAQHLWRCVRDAAGPPPPRPHDHAHHEHH